MATEEAREEVERVVMLGAAAAVLVALESLVAVLVVYAARLRVDEGFVGFADLDELVLGCGIVGVLIWVVLFGELAVGRLDLLVACVAGNT